MIREIFDAILKRIKYHAAKTVTLIIINCILKLIVFKYSNLHMYVAVFRLLIIIMLLL